MPDLSSPSTSSARDAVVDAMGVDRARHGVWPEPRPGFVVGCACGWETTTPRRFAEHKAEWERHVVASCLDAALGVTYTSPCPVCWGRVNDIAPGAKCKNPDCTDGRSAPRLALIDVLVAGGVLERYVDALNSGWRDDPVGPSHVDEDGEEEPPLRISRITTPRYAYRFPSNKES